MKYFPWALSAALAIACLWLCYNLLDQGISYTYRDAAATTWESQSKQLRAILDERMIPVSFQDFQASLKKMNIPFFIKEEDGSRIVVTEGVGASAFSFDSKGRYISPTEP